MTTTLPGRSPGTSRAAARPAIPRRAIRATAAGCAVAVAGAVALAACSATGPTGAGGLRKGASFGSHQAAAAPANPGALRGQATYGGINGAGSVATTSVPLPGQDIIYTAGLTVHTSLKQLQPAVSKAVTIATAVGGYTASEQMSTRPGSSKISAATLQLQIPVAGYQAAFFKLSRLGTPLAVSQQAQTVTTEVADVASRVTSAQAAISQLRALLAHAGSVGALLAVQDQINSQESALEALLAQQRALAHQTSYATVTLQLVTSHVRVIRHRVTRHGFLGGIAAGWHALRAVVAAVLTAVGAALPFAVIVAVVAALLLGGRRQLRRRRARPAAEA